MLEVYSDMMFICFEILEADMFWHFKYWEVIFF